jgi:glutamate formiminotransferase
VLIECVPNFSEGRDGALIARLEAAADSVSGAALLDSHRDPDHNRTVLTLAGTPQAVSEAVFRAVRLATDEIDLTRHAGVHPRIGAADVVPFVPLEGASLDDCRALAEALAERLARELELPVYLYAGSARTPERRRLPWIRSPGFEGLAAALASPERAPDLGPARPHPTAGAVAVGARGLLVAFNLDLDTEDLRIARRVARLVRESSGGLPSVQARGMRLVDQGRVMVSMNLTCPAEVGPGRVYREVARVAAAEGVRVAGAEVVGLIPRAAALECAHALLNLAGEPLAERTLEARLAARLPDPSGPLVDYLPHLAGAGRLDPGGGSAAAMALALATACLEKAIALSRGGKGQLSEAELDALSAGPASPQELLDLARDDHAAFASLMSAYGLPREDSQRKAAIRAARGPAVDVPRSMFGCAVSLAEAAARVAEAGNPNLVNDALAAAELASAAARVARHNALANARRADRAELALTEHMARLDDALRRARAAVES